MASYLPREKELLYSWGGDALCLTERDPLPFVLFRADSLSSAVVEREALAKLVSTT